MHAATAFVISHVSAWLTLRHGIVTLSILAGGVNITGIVPQLRTMLAARSSRGQSPLGWTLAATCSGSLLFVNSVGYHAYVLATGNLLSMSGCLTAALLARHLRDDGAVPAEALEALRDAPAELVSELAAPTLNSLTESVLEDHHRRTAEAIPGEVVSELRTVELQALTGTVLEEHHRRTGETLAEETVTEMPTHEFQALAEAILEEQHRRAGCSRSSVALGVTGSRRPSGPARTSAKARRSGRSADLQPIREAARPSR